ncbi:PadR family transcriptional regulator [Dysosmobacter sp. NSJ-60]|uniref:PadR family transcriptional regulator n=1 Tax=Pusillibacter faecalis TaxID=2714358 RepID=A0A810Q5E8_9FIRM|nr:PadR family transcriptional regulator [Pusillibacter faecalis]MBC5748785.1 PadR family transcriptional regulator [Dysosmobacter hominis]MBS5658503.1 PadR family transcriptional regulator [Oscillibacter sp.]MCQ5026858.1 PadR family transcriptional regulator [Oscillibacter valericigenes]BCK83320.1 PadR family transcriptional regulator [Pusillibacter faecalis]
MKKRTIDHTHLLVLSLLAGEDMYGYQMIMELARRSDHTFEMKEGTLYPVLHGLEREGLVEAYQQEAPTGRIRKYYHLTRRGAAFLKSEAKSWQTYSSAINAVLRSSLGLNPAP